MTQNAEKLTQAIHLVKNEVAKVIIGQEDVIDKALIAIFSGSHALVEGVPGVAKTLLVRTLARVMGCDFARIQFTPDLMPADITGTNVFNLRDNCFSLIKGPVFTSFLLADEINRAPAKTQSALLQAMQERSVSIDTETHELASGFTVFATQNPLEYEGTYPLPEAQKDRFLLKITMDMPDRDEELTLAKSMLGTHSPEEILNNGEVKQILSPQILSQLKTLMPRILIKEELVHYTVDIVRATRDHSSILAGAGPRATQSLILAGRACAAVKGRDFVTPDDIKYMAGPVLDHRIMLRPEYEIEGLTVNEVTKEILTKIAVPT